MCKVKVSMLVYAVFPLFDLQHDYIQIFLFLLFDSTHKLRLCVRREYVLAWCCMLRSLLFAMQHDHVLKKLKLDLMTYSQDWEGV